MDLIEYFNEHTNLQARGLAVDWQKVATTLANGVVQIARERDALQAQLTAQATEAPESPTTPEP